MGRKGGDSSNIEIFLRVKPTNRPAPYFAYDLAESKVDFNIPRASDAGYVNNQREHYEYKFNGIIPPDAKQDEVFERVARGALNSVMEGMNSTLFAYGQTGSGKTFTMTGGVERYIDRGIIPRAISAMFSEVTSRADSQYTVHISYLEIYQDTGYDLLDPSQDAKTLEDLPKVRLMEDEDGRINLQNLSMHRANSEEDALNLLFLGDTNRTISETPMNMASSRSHCIFTINLESRKEGGDRVRRSKLHLVDLAGSERVSKTGVDGTTLREAKYINLSLHYLEQVIIALQEISTGSGRTHIPYRNSMMTSVLRDSLGGNCRTAMIATIATEAQQLDESISTCRFALRVAMVSNTVMVNEEVDPTLIIKRLKAEVRELKEELRLLQGDDANRGALTEGEVERLKRQCVAYVNDPSDEAQMQWESMQHVRVAFSLFRSMCRDGGGAAAGVKMLEAASESEKAGGQETAASPKKGSTSDADLTDQLRKLRLQVQQRDNEINILVSMLKKAQNASGQVLANATTPTQSIAASAPAASSQSAAGSGKDSTPQTPVMDLLADRNKAFEMFRKSYRKNEAIEDNKALLKTKYNEAKALGETVNQARQRINGLKASIEQRRMQRRMQQVAAGLDPGSVPEDPEEEQARERIDTEKAAYKESFNRLRDLKKEIEHLQLLLEQSRQKLQADFEKWLESMLRQRAASNASGSVRCSQVASPAGSVPSENKVPAQVWNSNHETEVGRLPAPRPAWGEPTTQTLQSGGAGSSMMHSCSSQSFSPKKVPLKTGNADADADIAAFYEAREKLMRSRMPPGAG